MELYREQDIQAITNNMNRILEETTAIKNAKSEPTLSEFKSTMIIIRQFIKDKKRIIYGGDAFNTLVKHKDPKDIIYTEQCRNDIEFYTPDPIQDTVDLCNILHKADFKYVEGVQAQHDMTYSIFVNFVNMCDMTYMPKNVFSNMPVIEIDGLEYSDPTWMMVDVLRQYNDPMLSYQRVKDKIFDRSMRLFKNYPLKLNTKEHFTYTEKNDNKRKELFEHIVSMSTILFTGSIAKTYYSTLKTEIDFTALEVFSTDFEKDVITINEKLKTIFGNKYQRLSVTYYCKFFQFWDERLEFMIDDEHIITIYGPNDYCIPYNNMFIKNGKFTNIQTKNVNKQKNTDDDSCIKIVTFMVLFNHILIHRQFEYINKTEEYKKYENEMHILLTKREDFLKQENKNVLDNTPYREFVTECSGTFIDSRRKARLIMKNKREKGKYTMFRYNAKTQIDSYTAPDFKFSNISGKANDNGKKKLLKN